MGIGMDLTINYMATNSLVPYVNNSRTHSAQQVQQVAASIKEFGFTNPILVDEQGGIIAGHGRLQAAQLLGLDQVPTITLVGLTEAQRKAYIIADNQLALNAGWDADLLKLDIDHLVGAGFDVSLLGFNDVFINNLLSEELPTPALGLTPEEKLENFLDGDTKILRLAYDQDELEAIVAMLDKGLAATGADDYSSLVFGVVMRASAAW